MTGLQIAILVSAVVVWLVVGFVLAVVFHEDGEDPMDSTSYLMWPLLVLLLVVFSPWMMFSWLVLKTRRAFARNTTGASR